MSVCKICGEKKDELHEVTEEYLIKQIKQKNPEWVESDGACPNCIEYLQNLDDEMNLSEEDI